jgi:hypothetical protein
VIVEAGFTLMAEADATSKRTALARARQFRDGLMIALLAFHPIRLKNFAALEIGRSFVQLKNRWWIVLAADTKKEKYRPLKPPRFARGCWPTYAANSGAGLQLVNAAMDRSGCNYDRWRRGRRAPRPSTSPHLR